MHLWIIGTGDYEKEQLWDVSNLSCWREEAEGGKEKENWEANME